MKEKVYINIKGLQLAAQNVPRDYEEDEDDPVEVINVGRYRIINGKEYRFFLMRQYRISFFTAFPFTPLDEEFLDFRLRFSR